MEKSWNCVFEFLCEPCIWNLKFNFVSKFENHVVSFNFLGPFKGLDLNLIYKLVLWFSV